MYHANVSTTISPKTGVMALDGVQNQNFEIRHVGKANKLSTMEAYSRDNGVRMLLCDCKDRWIPIYSLYIMYTIY
jgi:hypothetical protein